MISGLWNGITGLNSFEKALSVESNNSSNVNTIGYKEDVINFADLMYKNNTSTSYGKGSTVATVDKAMYQQGGIKLTSSPYDVAIEGKGYFVVQNINSKGLPETYYTRAGNFKVAESGFLQTQGNMDVMGLVSTKTVNSTNGTEQFDNSFVNFIASQNIGNLNNLQTINTKATDYKTTAKDDDLTQSGSDYKTKSSKINDIDALILDYKNKLKEYSLNSTEEPVSSKAQKTEINFSTAINNLQNENDYIKVNINGNQILQNFDPKLGLEGTLKAFSDKISNIAGLSSSIDTNTGILKIDSLITGKEVIINEAYINKENLDLKISNIQEAEFGSGIAMVESARDALKSALQKANADLLEITNNVSLESERNGNLDLSSIQLNLLKLGISNNSSTDMEISDGIIYIKDGENKFVVGKLQTASFVNEQGLDPQGGNLYSWSKEAGDVSNANGLNKLVSNSLEQSKANLANSLTALMIYQKAFEANSKSVTTSDEMLQTAIQLKK